jgi:hypothetical protein
MEYYAVQLFDTMRTTQGKPHPITGLYSIAHFFRVFKTRGDREAWLDQDLYHKRRAVTKRQLRQLNHGMSVYDFEEMLSNEAFYEMRKTK